MAKEFKIKARIVAEDRASPEVARAQGSFKRFGNFLKDKFVITLGDVSRAAKAAFGLIKEAANLEGQQRALELSLAEQGQSFDKFIGKLKDVSRGTVATADLIKASSSALLLGIPADKISELLEVARASAIATGTSVGDAFRDIATGIGRASPLILDNLGITVKLGSAYEEMARKTGKSTEALTEQERKTALLNKVLQVGKKRVELFGEAHSKTQEAIQKGTAAIADFNIGAGKVATGAFASLSILVNASAAGWIVLARVIYRTRAAWNEFTGDLSEAVELRKKDVELAELVDRLDKLGGRLAAARDAAWSFGNANDDLTPKIEKLQAEAERAASSTDTMAEALDGAGEQAEEATEELDGYSEAVIRVVNEHQRMETSADNARTSLEDLQRVVIITAAEFDALAAAEGRAVAEQAALQGGGTVTLGGRRINLPGGGSRLITTPGLLAVNTGRYNADGTLRRY
jgi:methyl-accepting chemotaxis protein